MKVNTDSLMINWRDRQIGSGRPWGQCCPLWHPGLRVYSLNTLPPHGQSWERPHPLCREEEERTGKEEQPAGAEHLRSDHSHSHKQFPRWAVSPGHRCRKGWSEELVNLPKSPSHWLTTATTKSGQNPSVPGTNIMICHSRFYFWCVIPNTQRNLSE